MAHTFEFNATSSVGRFANFSGISRLVETVRTRYAQHRVYRNTLTELQSLSRRDLNDLGLNPHNLHGIAFEAAYGAAN